MAKAVVFGHNWLSSGKVVGLGKSGSNREKWLYSGKVVVFGQKWLYSYKSCCICTKWLYSGKVVVFGQKWL